MKTKILFTFLGLLLSTTIFAQSKDLAKMYNQLDSLENRILELQRENDKAVLECVNNGSYSYKEGCSESIVYKDDNYKRVRDPFMGGYGENWDEIARKYAQEICECKVGKKHETEAVKTQIKQLERKIDLIKESSKPSNKQSSKPAQKDDSKPAQNVKK
jgi:polyhydroxyalkanoate synthesis regulator phasin